MSVADGAPVEERGRPRGRAHVVDLLRLLMSVQMISGHTIAALLDDGLRRGAAFERWTWMRGLTAVGFLVASGVSFYLSSLARWDAYRADAANRRRRVRRALLLIAIGYLLHFPAGVLSGDPALARAALLEAAMVDVLQCIGVTMLALEALVAVARRSAGALWAAACLAVLAIGLAPLAASINCEPGIALPFCNYLSRSGGSLFPLLPWSGFVLAGVVLGAIALPQGPATPGLRSAVRMAGAGVATIGCGLAIDVIARSPADPILRSASPALSLVRLGCVALIAAALALLAWRIEALPRWVRVLAGETLFLYVSHLLVLYVAGVGLARTIGPTLGLGAAIAVALAMIAGCAAGALVWAKRPWAPVRPRDRVTSA